MKHLPEIRFEAIPHKSQRYETCGDYFKEYNHWKFQVSKTNVDYEFLILIHELIEWYLAQKKGIKLSKIDAFDKLFEKEREIGVWADEEPGDDPRAPYKKEHQFATQIEKLLAKRLKINWNKYNKDINKLSQ